MPLLKNIIRNGLSSLIYKNRVRLGDGEMLKHLTSDQLAEIRRFFPLPKFFVFGHARSGTTLLARLLRLHPDVHCNWQAQFFSQRGLIPYLTAPSYLKWLNHPSNRWTDEGDRTTISIRVLCDYILEGEAQKVKKRVVGDKSPNENGAQAVCWLNCVYPDAYLIYIIRDGRDTVLSKRIQMFIDQAKFLDRDDRKVHRALLRDPQPFIDGRRSLFTPKWLEKAAKKWADNVHESVRLGKELFGKRFFAIRYEDILTDPYVWMTRLWSFLEVAVKEDGLAAKVINEMQNNPAAEWHRSQDLDFVKVLPRGISGAWRSVYSSEDLDIFDRAAGKELIAWKYDLPD